MIPIRNCHIDAVLMIAPRPPLDGIQILVDGVHLRECYFFDEAAGVALAWKTDERGRVIAPLETVRVEGRVLLVGTPEQRAWYEEHFGALL